MEFKILWKEGREEVRKGEREGGEERQREGGECRRKRRREDKTFEHPL